MIEFMRSLFGLGRSASTRTVVGTRESFDLKEVRYIQDSKSRLASLHLLFNRYKNTPHAPKIKAVYDKTRLIHHFLISRNRGYELELFHLQHTDHFINTFSVIMDVHEKQHSSILELSDTKPKSEPFIPPIRHKKVMKQAAERVEMPRPLQKQQAVVQAVAHETAEPVLSVPTISINTIAKISYTKEESQGISSAKEMIGYVSTEEEKAAFLRYISARLGIGNISYVGNASVNLLGNQTDNLSGLVPVIHWREHLYALNLQDFRLFPVQIYRRGI